MAVAFFNHLSNLGTFLAFFSNYFALPNNTDSLFWGMTSINLVALFNLLCVSNRHTLLTHQQVKECGVAAEEKEEKQNNSFNLEFQVHTSEAENKVKAFSPSNADENKFDSVVSTPKGNNDILNDSTVKDPKKEIESMKKLKAQKSINSHNVSDLKLRSSITSAVLFKDTIAFAKKFKSFIKNQQLEGTFCFISATLVVGQILFLNTLVLLLFKEKYSLSNLAALLTSIYLVNFVFSALLSWLMPKKLPNNFIIRGVLVLLFVVIVASTAVFPIFLMIYKDSFILIFSFSIAIMATYEFILKMLTDRAAGGTAEEQTNIKSFKNKYLPLVKIIAGSGIIWTFSAITKVDLMVLESIFVGVSLVTAYSGYHAFKLFAS